MKLTRQQTRKAILAYRLGTVREDGIVYINENILPSDLVEVWYAGGCWCSNTMSDRVHYRIVIKIIDCIESMAESTCIKASKEAGHNYFLNAMINDGYARRVL